MFFPSVPLEPVKKAQAGHFFVCKLAVWLRTSRMFVEPDHSVFVRACPIAVRSGLPDRNRSSQKPEAACRRQQIPVACFTRSEIDVTVAMLQTSRSTELRQGTLRCGDPLTCLAPVVCGNGVRPSSFTADSPKRPERLRSCRMLRRTVAGRTNAARTTVPLTA